MTTTREVRGFAIVFFIIVVACSLILIEWPEQVKAPFKEWWLAQACPVPSRESGVNDASVSFNNSTNSSVPFNNSTTILRPPKPFDPTKHLFEVPSNIHYDTAGPRPEQVIVLTASDGNGNGGTIPNLLNMVRENRQQYCDYHGFICEFIDISKYDLKGANGAWGKIPAINDAFQTHPDAQWVWWLDLDAIIMTPSISLIDLILSREAMQRNIQLNAKLRRPADLFPDQEEIFTEYREPFDPSQIDLWIAQDGYAMNSGSFFLRRSTFTQHLLDLWRDPKLVHPTSLWREQYTLIHLIVSHPTIRSHVGIMDLRLINGNSKGDDTVRWQTRDLVIHFAGCSFERDCDVRWNQYWPLREELLAIDIARPTYT